MMKPMGVLALLLAVALAAAPAAARDGRMKPGRGMGPPMGGGPGMHGGFLERLLFPPDLLMDNAEALGLDEGQRDAIIQEIQQVQSGIVPLQWEIREQVEKLRVLLDQPQVDEKEALAQAERIAALEGEIKRTHLALLIRIKNLLRDDQRELLMELREQRRRRPPDRPE